MGDFNLVVLKGRVGQDAEYRGTASGTGVANFSLATSTGKNKDGSAKTNWHRIVCWGKVAQVAEEYVRKGAELMVNGEISYGEYENKDGVKIKTTDIVARSIVFCGARQAGGEATSNRTGSTGPVESYGDEAGSWDDVPL